MGTGVLDSIVRLMVLTFESQTSKCDPQDAAGSFRSSCCGSSDCMPHAFRGTEDFNRIPTEVESGNQQDVSKLGYVRRQAGLM